jgi:hypothetical protein
VEETGVPGENHRTDKLYHIMLYPLSGIRTNIFVLKGTDSGQKYSDANVTDFSVVNVHSPLARDKILISMLKLKTHYGFHDLFLN